MSTVNPFDLLGDDDNDDPSHLIAVQQQKIASKKPAAAPLAAAKLPSKPLPPAQAVREVRNNTGPARGGAGRGGPGRGRGGRGAGIGSNRDYGNGNGNANGFIGGYGGGGGSTAAVADEGDAGKPLGRELPLYQRGSYGPSWQLPRHGRPGPPGTVGVGQRCVDPENDPEHPRRRVFERRSGTGRGNDIKREGAGRGNWGTVSDDVLAQETVENLNVDEKTVTSDEQPRQDDGEAKNNNKESPTTEAEEKEAEDKEMTLEEYEKIREEKRKALLAMKAEERKVQVDKELESMQQLSLKKGNDAIFIKLGSDKDSGKRRENNDREERVKKPVSINEFLKPAEGERFYGRGRGRGRGDRAPFRGGFGGGGSTNNATITPSIEDPGQFPTLGGK